MSKAEILDELPRLSVQEREEILDHLRQLDEEAGPNPHERLVLNEAQAAYDADQNTGELWSQVEAQLRAGR